MTAEIYCLPCMGSKKEFAAKQLQALEQCPGITTLVDVCGGGGTIALSADKGHFHTIQYNDLDPSRVNLIRALQSKDTLEAVVEKMNALVAQYDEPIDLYNLACKESLNQELDMVTSAAYAIIWSSCSKGSAKGNFKGPDDYKKLVVEGGALTKLPALVSQAQGLTVSQTDLFKFLEENKEREDILAYIDPPYIYSSSYGIRFGVAEHTKLVEAVVHSKMKIALCLQTSSGEWGALNERDELKKTTKHGGFAKKVYFSAPDEQPYIELRRVQNWHLYGFGRRVDKTYYFAREKIKQDTVYPEVAYEELMFTNFEVTSMADKEWTQLDPL